jgi:hypothetical protein
MIIPRSKAKLSLLVALGGVAAGIVACTYNWSVGASSVQPEGGAPDGTAPDGSGDATLPPEASAADGGSDGAPPPADAGVSCAKLAKTLEEAANAAKTCSGPTAGQCTTDITNECGCKSYVADAGSSAANAYAVALSAFEDAGCPPSCDGGCVNPIGSCLLATGFCYP